MATVVLTGFTITGLHLSNTATTATATGLLGNEISYDSFDFGVGYFAANGSAYFESTFVCTANSGASFLGASFSDTANTYPNTVNSSGLQINTSGTAITALAQNIVSNVISASVSGVTLTIGTTYYTRIGYLSSLGQFGGTFVQFFSDAARTAYVGAVTIKRTIAPAYRYFLALQSLNGGATGNVSATNADITIFKPANAADLLVYTLVGAPLASVTNCVTVSSLGTNESTYLHSNTIFPTNFFSGDFYAKAALSNAASIAPLTTLAVNILSFVNIIEHGATASTRQAVVLTWLTASTFNLKIESYIAGTFISATTPTLSTTQPYWLDFNRVGGVLTLNVFNDPTLLSLNCSVTLIPASAPAFQYFMPIQSRNLATNSGTTSFTLGGVSANIPALTVSGISARKRRAANLSAVLVYPITVANLAARKRRAANLSAVLVYPITVANLAARKRRKGSLLVSLLALTDTVTWFSSTAGAVVTLRVYHNGLFLDFSDNVFKASGWVTPSIAQVAGAGALNMYYSATITTNNWSGEYTYISSSNLTEQPAPVTRNFVSGVAVTGGMTFADYIMLNNLVGLLQTNLTLIPPPVVAPNNAGIATILAEIQRVTGNINGVTLEKWKSILLAESAGTAHQVLGVQTFLTPDGIPQFTAQSDGAGGRTNAIL